MVVSPIHFHRICLSSSSSGSYPYPPKLSKSAKEDLIVAHLRSTGTCHTLKDLEKMLPSVASINGMQVKEYLQSLTDENKIRVEKIGSGNWYWCFGGDENRERERRFHQLQKEVDVLQASSEETGARLAAKRAQWSREEHGGGEDGIGTETKVYEAEREELTRRKRELQTERNQLQAQWKAATASEGGKNTQQMMEETEGFRQQALLWTDNIYVLEQYMGELTGGDRAIVTAIQREYYGDEYVEGEGLRELR